MRIAFASALLVLALVAPARGQTIEVKDAAHENGDTWTLRFPGDDFDVTFDHEIYELHSAMGTTDYLTTDGIQLPVPNYVVNVLRSIHAMEAHLKAAGLSGAGVIGSLNIHDIEDSGQHIRFAAWRWVNIDMRLSAASLATTPAHEWFHCAQDRHWDVMDVSVANYLAGGPALEAAVEGTATWAEDLPIPIRLAGVTPQELKPRASSPPATLDDLDSFAGYNSAWSDAGGRKGFLGDDGMRFKEYSSVFFWKSFARRCGSGEKDLGAVKRFWDKFAAKTLRTRAQFIEAAGSMAPGSGSNVKKFQRFYEGYLADMVAVQQAATGEGYPDEGVKEICHPDRGPETGHYSTFPREIPRFPAASAEEARERLASIAIPFEEIGPFGYQWMAIAPRRALPTRGLRGDPELFGKGTSVALLVTGDRPDAWAAVAFSQSVGPADAAYESRDNLLRGSIGRRWASVNRLGLSMVDSTLRVGGKPAALLRFPKEDGFLSQMQRLWVGLANVDPSDGAKSASVAWAVTPLFDEFACPDHDPSLGFTLSLDRTVRFKQSRPARDPKKDSFRPGDRVTLEVRLSDLAHVGGNVGIELKDRTLDAMIFDEGGAPANVLEADFTCADPLERRYEYSFLLPDDFPGGEFRVTFSVTSLLRLGDADRNEDSSFTFRCGRNPVLVDVALDQGTNHLYTRHSGLLRPASSGDVAVSLLFDRDMDTSAPPALEGAFGTPAGSWSGATRWNGSFKVPGGEAFQAARGWHTLRVKAKSASGDEVHDKAGDRYVVDSLPPWLKSVEARPTGGEAFYKAEWRGGTDVEAAENLLDDAVQERERYLFYATRTPVPADADEIEIWLRFAGDLPGPVEVQVGNAKVPVAWEGGAWIGRFRKAAAGPSLLLTVSAADRGGNALDADPHTVTRLVPARDDDRDGAWWRGWEAVLGGPAGTAGGPDAWHNLGAYAREDWTQTDIRLKDTTWVGLTLRGSHAVAQVGGDWYTGTYENGNLRLQRTTQNIEELFGSWYRNYVKIPTPPRPGLDDLWARWGASGQLSHAIELTADGPDTFRGNRWPYSVTWKNDDTKVETVKLHAVPWEVVWRRNAPADGPDEPDPPPVVPPAWSPVEWQAWKVESRPRSGWTEIDVIEVKYLENKAAGWAWLVVRRTPVSTAEDRETGRIAWSINRAATALDVFKRATTPADIDALRARAEALKPGDLGEGGVEAKIGEILGPKSHPLR